MRIGVDHPFGDETIDARASCARLDDDARIRRRRVSHDVEVVVDTIAFRQLSPAALFVQLVRNVRQDQELAAERRVVVDVLQVGVEVGVTQIGRDPDFFDARLMALHSAVGVELGIQRQRRAFVARR